MNVRNSIGTTGLGERTRHGFTLIELILAIGLAAIVLVAVNGAFFGAVRLRNRTAETIDAAAPLDQAAEILRRDLSCAVAPKPDGVMSGAFRAGNVSALGLGQPVQLEFHTATAVMDRTQPWGEVQRVAYGLRGNGNSRDLYRSVTRNLLTLGTPQTEDQLVLRDVSQFRVQCFDGAMWTETWDTSDTAALSTNLPLAVRLQIQRGGNSDPSNPTELLVPVRVVARNISNTTL